MLWLDITGYRGTSRCFWGGPFPRRLRVPRELGSAIWYDPEAAIQGPISERCLASVVNPRADWLLERSADGTIRQDRFAGIAVARDVAAPGRP